MKKKKIKCSVCGSKTAFPIYERVQIEKIKSFLETHYTFKNLAYFKLGINLGFRSDNLRCQKWEDYLDDKGNIREFLELKGKNSREIQRIKLNASIYECLTILRTLYPNDVYLFQTESTKFNNSEVRPWSKGYTQVMLKKAAEAANITDRITPTSLRKTFAYHTVMTGKGNAIVTLMKMLGHSSLADTFQYVCLRAQDTYDLYNLDL